MTDLTEAFEGDELREQSGRIRALARGIVTDSNTADDLAQQAMLSELRKGDEAPARSPGFFAGMLRNLARREWRGAERRRRREAHAARRDVVPPADEAVQHAETLQKVVQAALALDEPYRSTILLRYLQDQSAEEVAGAMGVPASTVRVRTKRAIAKLRDMLRASMGAGFLVALEDFAFPVQPMPALPSGPSSTSTTTPTLEGSQTMTIQALKVASIGVLAVGASMLFRDDATSLPEPEFVTAGHTVAESSREDRGAGGDATRRASALVSTPSVMTFAVTSNPVPLTRRVVDASGAPVAGATVRVWNRSFEGSNRYRSGALASTPAVVTTDATGTFTVPSRSGLESWGIDVKAPGYATTIAWTKAHEPKDIVMYAATTLSGTITNAGTGQPIEGVAVRVFDVLYDGAALTLHRSVTTDAAGSYSIDGVRAGNRTRVEFGVPGALSCYELLNLEPAASNTHDVSIDTSASAAILARDAATMTPVAEADVWASGRQSTLLGQTDAQGRYIVTAPRIQGSAIGWMGESDPTVFVEKNGYAATARRLSGIGDGTTEYELRLVQSGSVTGIVRDTEGTPVAGAHVSWIGPPLRFVEPRSSGVCATDSRTAVTDANGAFALPNVLPADGSVEGTLEVRYADLRAVIGEAMPASGGANLALDVVLRPSYAIEGQVLVNGNPTPDGWIVLRANGDTPRDERTLTSPDGRFRISGLPAGEYTIDAKAIGTTVSQVVTISDADVTELELNVAAAVAYASGSVLYDDGAPAIGSTVAAFFSHNDEPVEEGEVVTPEDVQVSGPEGGGAFGFLVSATSQVAADGTFSLPFENDPTKRYNVTVFQGGFGVSVGNVAQGAHGIELRIPRLAKVRLALSVAGTGAPIRNAGVRWVTTEPARDVTLAWNRPIETLQGVLPLELPIGTFQLTLRDCDRDVTHTMELTVPVGGLPDTLSVEF